MRPSAAQISINVDGADVANVAVVADDEEMMCLFYHYRVVVEAFFLLLLLEFLLWLLLLLLLFVALVGAPLMVLLILALMTGWQTPHRTTWHRFISHTCAVSIGQFPQVCVAVA